MEDDDVEEDEDEDDQVMSRGRKRMTLRRMMVRSRKTMILRILMWRRRTDPKTATHVLCESAQSKCAWTCHKSLFFHKSTGKRLQSETGTLTLCEPA